MVGKWSKEITEIGIVYKPHRWFTYLQIGFNDHTSSTDLCIITEVWLRHTILSLLWL